MYLLHTKMSLSKFTIWPFFKMPYAICKMCFSLIRQFITRVALKYHDNIIQLSIIYALKHRNWLNDLLNVIKLYNIIHVYKMCLVEKLDKDPWNNGNVLDSPEEENPTENTNTMHLWSRSVKILYMYNKILWFIINIFVNV